MALLVGLDVGTSSAKAVVFTDQGEVVGEGRASTPWITTSVRRRTRRRGAAQCCDRSTSVGAGRHPGTTSATAVGITSMGESGVLVDRNGTPVAPVIAWHDNRDQEEVEALRRDIAADTFAATTGKPLRGQWAITKHRWLLRHVPSAATAVRRFNIAEWVVRGLGGDEVTELALALPHRLVRRCPAVTGGRRDLAWSGATPGLMPPLVEAGTPVGHITRSDTHPRLHGAVLTVVGHDHQAAAVGVGAIGEGDEVDSCGSAEAIVRTIPAYLKGRASP